MPPAARRSPRPGLPCNKACTPVLAGLVGGLTSPSAVDAPPGRLYLRLQAMLRPVPEGDSRLQPRVTRNTLERSPG
jgi:hypothetical protein